MSAAPELATGAETERPPAQETPKPPASLNEALTGAPAPRSPESLRETEARSAQEGMAKLNEMGKNLNLQAEAGAQEFKQETKSVWERIKGRFSRKGGAEAAPVKGDAEILMEIEKADSTFREFRKEMARIMAHGGEAELRVLERNLSAAYDELAPKVAEEGEKDPKAMKQALKDQESPQATETGAKLNYVTKRLADVRAKLAGEGATGSTEQLAAANAAYEKQAAAESKADRDRSELEKASAGKPGEKMVAEYLAVRDLKADKYGPIAARAFDPIKGEIRLTYEDGSQLRRYASGQVLRVLPGGKIEEVKPEAQIVEDAEPAEETGTEEDAEPAEEAGPEEVTEPEEEIFNEEEKARLLAEPEKTRRIAEMGQRVDAAMAAEDEAAAMQAVGGLEKDAAAEKMAERQRQWDADKAEHERQRNEKLAAAAKRKAMGMKTSEDARTASGEIDTEPAAPEERTETPEAATEAPTLSTQPDAELEFVPAPSDVETAPAAEPARELETPPAQEAPAASTQPDAALEFVAAEPPAPEAAPEPPSTELSEAQIAKAKEHPLAPESLPAIVKTLRDKGKAGDGKFATPASFMQALEDAGFKMPTDMEANDPKKLHEAYKKASRPRT